jgi:hypothetical protein
MSGSMACEFVRIALCQSITYGTISAKVVTHRLCLLVWFLSQDGIYDEATSLKCLFYNGFGKCPVAKNFFDTPFLDFTAEDFVRGTLSSDAEDD